MIGKETILDSNINVSDAHFGEQVSGFFLVSRWFRHKKSAAEKGRFPNRNFFLFNAVMILDTNNVLSSMGL